MSLTIALDCRPLQENQPTGIAVYTAALKQQWLDRQDIILNTFTIGRKVPSGIISSRHKHYQLPGKLFNLLSSANIDYLPKDKEVDFYFLPHPTFWPVRRKPYVLTVHDLAFIERPYYYAARQRLWHWRLNLQRLINSAAGIICVSQATKARLSRLYPATQSKPLAVIPEGLSVTSLTAEQEKNLEVKLKLPSAFLLYTGTLEPRKNIESLLAAFRLLRPQYPELHLLLAGKYGWSSRRLERFWRDDDHIRWLGYVSDENKTLLYQKARALVWPSWYEGFGFPPLEAAYWGTPIVASWSTALPEILQASAHYINPYNYQELAACLRQIMQAPRKKPEINAVLSDRHSWQGVAAETLDFIKSL